MRNSGMESAREDDNERDEGLKRAGHAAGATHKLEMPDTENSRKAEHTSDQRKSELTSDRQKLREVGRHQHDDQDGAGQPDIAEAKRGSGKGAAKATALPDSPAARQPAEAMHNKQKESEQKNSQAMDNQAKYNQRGTRQATDRGVLDASIARQVRDRASARKQIKGAPAENQAHHLTPVKVFDHPFVASAIKAGYNANENVASLPTSHDASIVENKPLHANHPNYTQQVEHIYAALQQRAEAEHWDPEMIKTAMSFTEVQLGLKLQDAGGGVKVNEVDLHTIDIDHIAEASKKFEAESKRIDREHLRRGTRNQSPDWETYWD